MNGKVSASALQTVGKWLAPWRNARRPEPAPAGACQAPPFRRKVLFESLEPRLLLSADVLPGAVPPALAQLQAMPPVVVQAARAVLQPQATSVALSPIGPLEAGGRIAASQTVLVGANLDPDYTVNLAAGQAISVMARPLDGFGEFNMAIFGPDGTQLWEGSNQQGEGGYLAAQNVLATAPGLHTVRLVPPIEGSATVSLDIAVDAAFETERFIPFESNDSQFQAVSLDALARPLPLQGSTRTLVVGSLGGSRFGENADDMVDQYAVTLDAGDVLAFELSMNKSRGSVYVRDGDGRLITSSVSIGPGADYFGPQGLRHLRVDTAGTYTLEVRFWDSQQPEETYTLAVARNTSLDPDADQNLGLAPSQLAYVAQQIAVSSAAADKAAPSPQAASAPGTVVYQAVAQGGPLQIQVLPINDLSVDNGPFAVAVQVEGTDGQSYALTALPPVQGQVGQRYQSVSIEAGVSLRIAVTAMDGQGQIQLAVQGAAAADDGPAVVNSAFDDGRIGGFGQWNYVSLSEAIRFDQVGQINLFDAEGGFLGTAQANTGSSDGNVLWISLPPSLQAGTYSLDLPAGTFVDLAGNPSESWSWQFTVDTVRPVLVATDPGPGGELQSNTVTLTFSEPMQGFWPALTLRDEQGNVLENGWTASWSPDFLTLSLNLQPGLPEGLITMQLESWSVRDLAENEVDVNPLTPELEPLVITFRTDADVYALPALASAAPAGALVQAAGREARLGIDDTDEFTFELQGGETFSAAFLAQPGGGLLPEVEFSVIDPNGNVVGQISSVEPGRALLLPDVQAFAVGTWRLRVVSINGSAGDYQVGIVRGAMVERDTAQLSDTPQAGNRTRDTAEDLDSSSLAIANGIDRLAALGQFSPGSESEPGPVPSDADVYRFTLAAGQSATVVLALDGDTPVNNLRLGLYDDSGDLASEAGRLLGAAIVSRTTDRAVLDFTNNGPDAITLYARAQAETPALYTLVVTRGATFDIGRIDDLPQPLGPTGAVIGAFDGVTGGGGGAGDLPTSLTLEYPINLVDGAGYNWDFYEPSGYVNNGTSDAYDGGLYLSVSDGENSNQFYGTADGLQLNGRQLAMAGVSITDVQVVRKVYVPTDEGFARYYDAFTNTSAQSREILVRLDTNLGSDGGTVLVNTASGDAQYTTADRWLVTDDSGNGSGDPTMTHLLWGEGGLAPESVSLVGDNLNQEWRLTLAPGQTVALLHFAAQSANRTNAVFMAERLSNLDNALLTGLSAAERAAIVNHGGLSSEAYRFWATAGDALDLAVSVTDGVSLPFQLVLIGPDEQVVLDTGLSQEPISGLGTGLTVGATGFYTVQVRAESALGNYLLEVNGATGQSPAPQVVRSTPANNQPVAGMPAYVDIAFDNFVRPDSADIDDLVLDPDTVAAGGGVTAVEAVDGRTLRFFLGAVAPGDRQVSWSIAEGAVAGFDGQGNAAAAGSFRVDGTGPQVLGHSHVSDAPLSSVLLAFSEALDPASLSLADVVSFTGPAGQDLRQQLTGLVLEDGPGVRVSFNAQFEAGTYTLVFGPDVRDLAGNRMDQDGNGQSGEASDVFTASIELRNFNLAPVSVSAPAGLLLGTATTVSYVVANTGQSPVPGGREWTDAIELVRASDGFVENVQTYRRFQSTDLLPNGQYSATVSYNVPAQLPVTEGSHFLRLVVDYFQGQREGNEADNRLASTEFQVTAPDLPNLVPSALTAPDTAPANSRIRIDWTVTNTGEATTNSVYYDRIELVNANGSVVQQLDVLHNGTVAAGQVLNRSQDLVIAAGLTPGAYSLRVRTDVFGQVPEFTGEADNVTPSRPLTIQTARLSDLANLRLDGAAPTELVLEQPLSFTYVADNIGTGGTENVQWTDRVQLVRVDTGAVVRTWNFTSGSGDGVAAGGQYSRVVDVSTPLQGQYPEGAYLLRVQLDVNNNLPESNDVNAALELPLTVTAPPVGNLVVRSVSAPPSAFAGAAVDVSWTLANAGDGDLRNVVGNQQFHDRVFAVNQATGQSFFLADFVYTGNIAAGAEVLRTQRVTLSDTLPEGSYRIAVQTDIFGWINEYTGENDNRGESAALPITQPPRVDLQVPSVTVPATAVTGQAITVSWQSRNAGQADFSGSFVDYIQFSTSPTFSSDVRHLADVTFTGSIAAGATVDRSQLVTLPLDMPGTWYARVVSDALGNVYEYQLENNNTGVSASTIALTLPPLPDLQVTDIQVPANATGGSTVTVSYRVTNAGTAEAGPRRDLIELRGETGSLVNLFQNLIVQDTLAAGASELRQVQITLPLNSGNTEYAGTLRARVTTDASQQVVEFPNEGNNVLVDDSVLTVVAPPLPNLRVSQIVAPQQALTEADIPLRWTVVNDGAAVSTGNWRDSVWLSADTFLGSGDRFLGSFDIDTTLGVGALIERVQNITLPVDLTGTFHIVVRTDDANQRFEGTAGETDNITFGPQITLLQRPIPNLVVTSVTPPEDAFSGQAATVSWTVRNVGNGSTSAPTWSDRVYLSTDGVVGADDIFLADVTNPGYLDINGEYASQATVVLPQGIDANYRFIVVSDVLRQVFEGPSGSAAEADNTGISAAARVRLTPPPDLRVTDIAAPLQAFSGQPITLNWTVRNEAQLPDGGRTRESVWYDRVWLSADQTLDGGDLLLASTVLHRGALDPQESYLGTLTTRLPVGMAGSFYVIVATDIRNDVYEHTSEENNARVDAAPVEILLTPPPDLEIVETSFADTARAGATFTVNYRAENLGATATPLDQANWPDRAWLSLDGNVDANDISLGQFWHYGALAVDGGYDGIFRSVLPQAASGTYNLLIQVDADDQLFESNNANNLLNAGSVVVFQRRPDLQVSAFTAPAQAEAGRTATFSWTVVNRGDGDSIADSWADALWGSTDNQIGNNDDYLIASVAHGGVLAPDGSYTVEIAPVLPFSVEGAQHFFLRTDAANQVFESNEGNNASAVLASLVLRDEPDLRVTQATATPVTADGRTLDLRFVIGNDGNHPTNANFWYDSVWLSTDATLGAGDTRIANIRHANALAPGQSYTVDQRLTLSDSLPAGTYYVLVRTDEDNVVVEGAGEANNVLAAAVPLAGGGSAATLAVAAVPVVRPDFSVVTVNAPETAFSGQRVTVGWTVRNLGDAAGHSYDQVFLSSDAFLDNGDQSLGFQSFGALAAGAERQGSLQVTLPAGRSGPFYVLVLADAGRYVDEPGAEANNLGLSPSLMQVSLAAPADLVAGTITLPADAVPGQNMAITYTVNNASTNAAVGTWRDTLYLSTDDTLDVGDVVFGSIDIGGPVAAGGAYTRTVTATVPGVASGSYRLIVRSDVRNVLPEASETNNISASVNGVALDVQALALDTPVSGTLSPNRPVFYKIDVAAGEALRFTLDGPGEDIGHEMFVRLGTMPTRSANDANTGEQFTPDPVVTVPGTQAGTYYVRIDPSPFQGGAYTLRATLVPFAIERVSLTPVGNTGDATLRIDGARFDGSTTFELVDSAGTVYTAHKVVLADAGRAYATFDLFGAAPGAYDLRAQRTSSTGATLQAQLLDSVNVVAGVGADAFLTIAGPTAVQVNRDASFQLNYSNDGDADTMAPLMIVTPSAGTTVGTSFATLGSQPLFLLGASLDGPADLLRPGARYTVPVAYKAPGQSGFLSVQARPVQADSTELVTDWTVIEASLRPVGVDSAEWNRFWSRVQPAIGSTLGNLVQVLNDMMVRLSPAGEPIRDVRALFAAQLAADRDWMPTQQVTGRLLDTGNATGLAGVGVQLLETRGTGWRVVGSAITEADGSFVVRGIKAGQYLVALDAGLLDMDRNGQADGTPPSITVTAQGAPAAATLYALPAQPEQPVVREDRDAELVVDSEGVVHMFWQRGDLYYHAYRGADGQFTEARPISESVGANLAVVAGATVIGGQPGLVAVWEQGTGNETELWAVAGMRDPAGGYLWSSPVQITNGSVASYSPDVEIDANGNAMLVFQRRDFAVQDDADLYAFTMLVDPVSLQWSDLKAPAAEAAAGQLEPLATTQVSVGYSKEFGPYEFLGFSFKTGLEGTAVATLDDAACQTTVALNAKGSIAVRVPGAGRFVGEGQARGSGVWNVDPATEDWRWAGGQIDMSASVKFEIKDGLFKLLSAAPPLAPLANGLRSAMNFVSKKTGGAVRLENTITPGITFEAKDLRWSTQSPFPNFIWPDSVGEMAVGGEVGLQAKAVIKSWDAEISLEGKVGFKATVYPSLSNPQITYQASLQAKVMGWVLINGEWSDSLALGSSSASLMVLAGESLNPEDEGDFIFLWDPTATLGTTNVYGSGAIDAQVGSNVVNDSPMRLARAGDGTVVGVFARDGDAVAGEIGNRLMVTTHGANGWTDEVVIPDTLGFNGEGVVTVLPDGSRVVVFSHATADGLTTTSAIADVMAARKQSDIYFAVDNGSGFGTPVLVAGAPGSDTDLAIAQGADGRMAIAWVHDDGAEQVLYSANWTGSGFAAATEVARTAGVLSNVTLALSGAEVLLAWNLDADRDDPDNAIALHTASIDGATLSTGTFETAALSAEFDKVLAATVAAADLAAAGLFGPQAGWPPFAVPEDCKKCTPEKLQKLEKAAPDCRPGGGKSVTLDSKACIEKTITYAPCVVQPRDPNDIIGPDGFGEERWVAASDTLRYTIRFENAADATAPAQVVTVTQTLDEDLDPRTLRIDDFGFASFRSDQPANSPFLSTRIDLRESQGIYVDVTARIDLATRLLTWVFTTIDPETGDVPVDATKGFLLPNDASGRGDGFISYTVRGKRAVDTGTRIDAEARIVFDTQGPIDTPPIFNTLDADRPESQVEALPATTEDTRFTVRWGGTDEAGGSAVRDYEVYVKVNDGDWSLWLFDSTDTEAIYEGEAGNRYAFYSLATDNAGNTEAAPAVADATIQVAAQTGSVAGAVFRDADADGLRDAGEAGVAGWTVFIDADADGTLDAGEQSTVTAEDGTWTLAEVLPGTWRVTLQGQADFDITAPVGGAATVTLAAGDALTGRDFGVLPLGSISGTQFDDTDGDGVFDAGEQGVAGWTVFLDTDGDGVLDAGERSTTTAQDGSYRFDGLRAGAYRVAQVLPEGWIQTPPAGAQGAEAAPMAFAVTLSGSLTAISLPACACGGTISTVAAQQAGWDEQLVELDAVRANPVFAGLDGRGVRVVVIDTGIDTAHPFFQGRIAYQYDFADDDADATDVNGHGTHVAGVIGAKDSLFGGVASGVELIVLKVFSDNGSASFADLERALQWVVANAEAYDIGVVNLSLGDGGNWSDAVSRYGLGDEFAALAARNIINVAAAGNNYAQTNALGVAYPAADPAVLSVGAVWSGDFGGPWSFGNGGVDNATTADQIASFSQRDDELLDTFAPGARLTAAAIGGGVRAMQGTSQSSAYVSGVAALAQQLAREHLGRSLSVGEFRDLLASTSVSIHDGDDERDNVVNSGLDFPRLDVAALVDALMAMSGSGDSGGGAGGEAGGGGGGTPAVPSSTAVSVVLGVDQDLTGVNLGAFKLGTVGGTVFDDRDGDGVRDAGEAGLAGAVVFVDADSDGVRDDGETVVAADAQGRWTLDDLGPGTLRLAVQLPAGWEATGPTSHSLTVTSGLARIDLDYGQRDIAPVAVDDSAGVASGQTVTGNVLQNDRDPGRADNAALSVALVEAPVVGSFSLQPDGRFSYTAPVGFFGTVSFRYSLSDGVSTDEGRVDIQVTHDMLVVDQFAGRHDGFTVVFSRPVVAAGLDVGGAAADVVVTNAAGQVVAGSLFLAADGLSARFLATGPALADGVYNVRLAAGAQALRDADGVALDGNDDGTPGDDWLGSFTVAKGQALSVGLADTARGPGQVLGLAPGDTGLAVRLSDGSGVTSVSFELRYDPALLGVATLQRGSGLPAGASFTVQQLAPGRLAVTIQAAGGLPAGVVQLARLVATVPTGAPLGASQVLDITALQVNQGALPALDDDATHVAAFPGDLDGDRRHTALDIDLMNALLSGSLVRPAWLPTVDAALLGDVNGSGRFDGLDPVRLGQALAGTGSAIVQLPGDAPPPPNPPKPPLKPPVRPPVVPPIVKGLATQPGWLSPLVSKSATVQANADIRVVL